MRKESHTKGSPGPRDGQPSLANLEQEQHSVQLSGAGFRVHLVSDDTDLLDTCRQVLRGADEVPSPPGADDISVCLWDYQPGRKLPALAQQVERVYYVVLPAHLGEIQAQIPESEGNILLKPVTRVVLWTFLGAATAVRPSSLRAINDEIGTLRANRDKILQHLLHANVRLQEYDQQRTNFIARAVHDFRAPLTALSGFCGLLAGGELGPLNAAQQEVVDRMQSNIQKISRMASAIFDLSTGPHLSRKPVLVEGDIVQVIQKAVDEVSEQAQAKQAAIRMDRIFPPTGVLLFEPPQIEEVLVNLLDNACRFVPKNGSIEIRGYPYFWERRMLRATIREERRQTETRPANAYRVDIIDNGPRIANHLLESVFEEYSPYTGPQDRSGGGLGLAICRHIVRRHDGQVWAEADRKENRFSFVLPFRRDRG